MKKVLVIAYYWPPSGGSGVQRWLKLCKYLPDFGWEPIVYTPENPHAPVTDTTLADDVRPGQQVITQPIMEPRRLLSMVGMSSGIVRLGTKFVSKATPDRGDDNRAGADNLLYLDPSDWSWKQRMLIWARSNLLIPDARALWIRPSVKFLIRFLEDHPVDAIVSTGPPQSMHLIARDLKRRTGIPWIADFRDPWTGVVYFDRLPMSRWALRKHQALEASVLREADAVVDVTPSYAEDDRKRGARNVHTIYNGFDESDFPEEAIALADRFTISHVGMYRADENHDAFWEALSRLASKSSAFKEDLELRLVGQVDPSAFESAERVGLGGAVNALGYVQHDTAVREMQTASVLLLSIPRQVPSDLGVITGKLFEYLASGRPILLLGPADGDAARIVAGSEAGAVFDYDDAVGIERLLEDWFEQHQRGELASSTGDISMFSRRNQAREFAELLENVGPNNLEHHVTSA